LTKKSLFVLPSREAMLQASAADEHSYGGYSLFNYYGNGPISRAKRKRFEHALQLAQHRPGGRVIDMGTADGIILPSLSAHYEHVAAIDVDPNHVKTCQRLVDGLRLPNVQVLCNAALTTSQVREQIGSGYQTMFLLETLEHVGAQPDMWGTKMDFLQQCFELLEPDGRIIISVPKMVGPVLLIKNMLQRALRLYPDQIPIKQLLKSSFLYNTDELEPLWDGHHVGFNHLKLDQRLVKQFEVKHRSESLISVFYLITRK